MIPVKGVASIEFAQIAANGETPATGWEKFTDIEMGSVSFNIPEPTMTRVQVEDKPGIWALIPEESEGASVTGKSLNMEPAIADLLFKGITGSTSTDRFDAPTDSAITVNLAVRITTKPYLNQQIVFVIPNAIVVARLENPLTKAGADFLAIGFTAEAITPSDAEGNPVSPWYFEKVPTTT